MGMQLTLEPTVPSFSFCSGSLFILRDTGEVHTATLTEGASCSPALGMHPPADDNYGSDACSLLSLPTTPPAVIIANRSSMIYHCVYLQGDWVGVASGRGQ